jgi:error-prone DNA polymerase
MNYADLQVTTHFSFLRGVSSAEELFSAAAVLGIKALGIVDRNSLAGMVRAHEASKVTGVRLIVGSRLDLRCGTSLLVYPTDRAAYGRLCRLLTVGKGRAGKGACYLDWPDVAEWNEGLLAILLPDELSNPLADELQKLRGIFKDRAYCALARRFLPDEAGFQKERHADRFLKTPAEMLRLFPKYESAVRRTWEIAESLPFLARPADLHLSDRRARRRPQRAGPPRKADLAGCRQVLSRWHAGQGRDPVAP